MEVFCPSFGELRCDLFVRGKTAKEALEYLQALGKRSFFRLDFWNMEEQIHPQAAFAWILQVPFALEGHLESLMKWNYLIRESVSQRVKWPLLL